MSMKSVSHGRESEGGVRITIVAVIDSGKVTRGWG